MTQNVPQNEWLGELNCEQKAAVTHGEGPLIVVAGAGSGKTRTLAYRVAYLISQGVPPEKILLLTFTRRAAEEMLRRAGSIAAMGGGDTGRVWGGTFHSTANRLLRIYAKSAGLWPDFTVMDQSDSQDLINVVRHEMGLHKKEKRFPRKQTCLAVYSRCVNSSDPLKKALYQNFPWCEDWEEELRSLFRHYVIKKQERHVLDYDDLLLYWAKLSSNPEIRDHMEKRFDHVLVDEYQDTNSIQSEILRNIRTHNRNITVVGDDAQSIYSFRAATVRNMLDFPKMFPGATTITLEQNYRSVQSVLETTNRLIQGARERYTKDLWSEREAGRKPRLVTCRDERQQNDYLIDRILEHYEEGIPLKQQAVLFRIGYLSDSLEVELSRRNIPFHKYGGLRFIEAAHVKDVISFLRVAENPRDEIAWFRALQLLDGIGPATAAKIMQSIADSGYDARKGLTNYKAPAASAGMLKSMATLMEQLASMGNEKPAGQVELITRFYTPLLQKNYENAAVRLKDAQNLENIASGYRSRRKFLTDLQLDPPQSTSDLAGSPSKDEDWLVLSTIHSAKGCEWDAVYLIHAADGCLPSDMSTDKEEEIEEEMRLAYVAMTRPRDFLYVTWPLRYYHKKRRFTDHHSYAQLSRFFTDDVIESMDREKLVQYSPDDAPVHTRIQDDVTGIIREMWD